MNSIPTARGKPNTKRQGDPAKTTVLLVEDSKFLQVATGRLLTRAGYTVVIASDGEEALSLAHETLPDLILLDMLLPKLSGPQVLQALKTTPDTAHIPVIVLSSLSQLNEEKLKTEGAAMYFEKSKLDLDASGETLIHAIEKVLHARKKKAHT